MWHKSEFKPFDHNAAWYIYNNLWQPLFFTDIYPQIPPVLWVCAHGLTLHKAYYSKKWVNIFLGFPCFHYLCTNMSKKPNQPWFVWGVMFAKWMCNVHYWLNDTHNDVSTLLCGPQIPYCKSQCAVKPLKGVYCVLIMNRSRLYKLTVKNS